MPDFATLRVTWEPRILSVLRIVVGVLYMEHGLAKILDFPHQPNHAPYALFTLNPGLQGLLELVGGLLLALGLFTRTVAFVLAGNMAVAYFMVHAPRDVYPLLNAGSWRSSTRSSSSISGSPRAANGALIEYASPHLHPPYRRAGPEQTAIARKPRKLRLYRSPPTPTTSCCCTTGGSPPHSCGIKTDFASPRDRIPSAWTASTGRSLRTAPEPRSRRRLSRSLGGGLV